MNLSPLKSNWRFINKYFIKIFKHVFNFVNLYLLIQDPSSFGANDAREIALLEDKNESLKAENKELESKWFQEKADKDKVWI